jgi:type VI secretion system secreted protein Hcp
MRKKLIWAGAALVLIAIPAVIGLVALRGDDDSRRSAALIGAGAKGGAPSYQLEIPGVTPAGKAIDVESYQWGISNAGSADRSGLTRGTPQLSDLVITKKLDQTSPILANHVATGKLLQSAVLTLYKQDPKGGILVKYATYTMTDVLIGAVSHSGGGAEIPSESVSLNYAKLQTSISTLDTAGLSPPEQATWDLALLSAQ